jgi:hypothetical protein
MTREEELSQIRKQYPAWSIVSQRHFNVREYVAIKMLDNYRVLRHSASTVDELKEQLEAENA